jgi:type VI protein secretion system component Hcp
MNARPRSGLRWLSPRAWFLALCLAVAALILGHVTAPNPLLPADWITSSQAVTGSTSYYLKADGITGDATATGHVGEIQVNGWQFAVTRSVAAGAGGNRSAGKVACSDFSFTTLLSSASPGLLRANLTGTIPEVRLSGNLDAGHGPAEFIAIDFTPVFMDGYSISSGGALPTESISFAYDEIQVSYRSQNPDGSLGNAVTTAWNCVTNTPITPTTTATSTVLTSSSTNPTYGDSLTLTATVAAGSAAPDRGEVTFHEGATVLCSAVALSGGVATCSIGVPAAGSHTYSADYTALSGFGPSSGFLAVSVNQKALTVTADNQSKVYGQPNPAFTASYSGFVSGDSVASLSGSLTFATAATAASGVGAYDITPGGLTSANYSITFVNGTLTVSPAPLTITADPQTKVYGQPNPAFTVSYASFVNGDTAASLGGSLTFTTAATAASGVGAYDVVPSGLTSSNYSITFVKGTLAITAAPLSVTADPQTKVYGQANPTFTASYSGFVNGDTAASLGGSLTFTTAATTSSPAGSYDVTPGGLTSSNYTVAFAAGQLTITRAPLTVTANDSTRTYGAPAVFTVTYSGFVLGETSTTPGVLGGTLTFVPDTQNSPVGVYSVTPAGLTATNYAITYVAGTLTITKAPLTIKADDKVRPYGSPNPTLTVTYTGFVLGENATTPGVLGGTLSLSTTAQTTSLPGAYPITVGGLTARNYDITFAGGTLTVTRAPLLVIADNATKDYGDRNPRFGVTYAGFVLGQGPDVLAGDLTITTVATKTSPAGTYPIVPGGVAAANYQITFVNGTLTVTKDRLRVVVRSTSRDFGAPNPPFSVRYIGFVLDETATTPGVLQGTLSFSTADQSSPVGRYPITASGLTAPNYDITFVDGTLTIRPAGTDLTVTVDGSGYSEGNPYILVKVAVSPAALAGSQQSGSVDFFLDDELRASQQLGAGGTASSLIRIEGDPGEAEVEAVFTSSNPNFTSAEGSNTRPDDSGPGRDRSEAPGYQ